MRLSKIVLLTAVLVASSVLAKTGSGKAGSSSGDFHPALFCDGTYALCIKALCSPDESARNRVRCVCDVVQGWNMGPESCEARRKHLFSTYSNLYNDTHKTLACNDANTRWAWCYGAPCTVDAKDPAKAICSCPVKTGPARTLGGDCQKVACRKVWSAATPAADQFANRHFHKYMQDHNRPSNPPAQACLP
jgi:hypothetical protein